MEVTHHSAVNSTAASFFRVLQNPVSFRLFLLKKLPAALFSGVIVTYVDENSCRVKVPFNWFTQNPFRSTYFACLAMAAEMSTGVLAMAYCYQRRPSVSLLITAMESKFYKKAVGMTTFTCNEGAVIKEAVQKAIDTTTPQTVTALSQGYNNNNELVAEFRFTWSFKVKVR